MNRHSDTEGFVGGLNVEVKYIPIRNFKPFNDLNFKIAYGIKLKENMILEVSLGMKNIFNSYQKDFDKGELRDAGYIYGPVLPRSLFAGLKFSL